jgi:hypothetical protein
MIFAAGNPWIYPWVVDMKMLVSAFHKYGELGGRNSDNGTTLKMSV